MPLRERVGEGRGLVLTHGGIANVHLHMRVREVFILTKPWDTSLAVHTRQLAKWLLENGYNVYVPTLPPSVCAA